MSVASQERTLTEVIRKTSTEANEKMICLGSNEKLLPATLGKKKTPSLTTVMGRSKIRVATHVAGFPTSRVRCTGRSPGFHPDSEGGWNPFLICSHQPQTL